MIIKIKQSGVKGCVYQSTPLVRSSRDVRLLLSSMILLWTMLGWYAMLWNNGLFFMFIFFFFRTKMLKVASDYCYRFTTVNRGIILTESENPRHGGWGREKEKRKRSERGQEIEHVSRLPTYITVFFCFCFLFLNLLFTANVVPRLPNMSCQALKFKVPREYKKYFTILQRWRRAWMNLTQWSRRSDIDNKITVERVGDR